MSPEISSKQCCIPFISAYHQPYSQNTSSDNSAPYRTGPAQASVRILLAVTQTPIEQQASESIVSSPRSETLAEVL